MTPPSLVNRAFAIAAIEDFFADENWRRLISEYGWVVGMVDPLTIFVSLSAHPINGVVDVYTLRLACSYYPTHPPDVIFVNPATFEYDAARDKCHVANLQAPYCYVHLTYSYQQPYQYGPQLVCSSMTLGYYFSGHSPTPDQKWQPGRQVIGTTIYTVYRALHSQHYHGRHAG